MFNGYDLLVKLCPTKCTSHVLDHDALNMNHLIIRVMSSTYNKKMKNVDYCNWSWGKTISSIVNKAQQNMHNVTLCPPTHLEYKDIQNYNLWGYEFIVANLICDFGKKKFNLEMVSLGWHVVPLLLQRLGQLAVIRHLFEQRIYSNLQHTIYIFKTFVTNQINLKKNSL